MKIENFEKMTDFQQWVICSAMPQEAFKVEKEEDEQHTVTLSFNGVETDFLEWCDRLEYNFDVAVIEKAQRLAQENFEKMMDDCYEFTNTLEEIHNDLETKIRHKLELPTWEERFGE